MIFFTFESFHGIKYLNCNVNWTIAAAGQAIMVCEAVFDIYKPLQKAISSKFFWHMELND